MRYVKGAAGCGFQHRCNNAIDAHPHRKFVRMASNDVHAWIQFRSLTSPIQRDSEFRIGRSIGSDLRLFEETSISREHSVVTSHNGKLEVTDLNSRNGTRVN